jgi:hypothetical protein
MSSLSSIAVTANTPRDGRREDLAAQTAPAIVIAVPVFASGLAWGPEP